MAEPEAEQMTEILNDFFVALSSKLEQSFEPVEEVAETIGSTKTIKGAKEVNKTFQSMIGASFKAALLEQVIKLIDPFLMVMKLLAPLFSALNALLTAMMVEFIKPLIPITMALTQALLKLMPVFKAIGKFLSDVFIGFWQILFKFLVGFGEFLSTNFSPVIKSIAKFLADFFIPIWERMMVILKSVVNFVTAIFQPLWVGLRLAFQRLVAAWNATGGKLFGPDGIIAAAIKGLFDIGKGLINSFINGINTVIGTINKIPGVDLSTIPVLDNPNGSLVTGPTFAALAMNRKPEIVQPAEQLQAQNEAIVEKLDTLIRLMEKSNQDIEMRELFRR